MHRYLFVLWEGGGNVPPQLGLARELVRRGHAVRVLGEDCLRAEVEAAGCAFVPFRTAPNRPDRSRATDYVRDGEASNPLSAFARHRDRLMMGPALAHARDVLEELERAPADVLVSDYLLTGAQAAGEKARVPTALLCHSIYLVPEPGKPAPGLGLLPGRGPLIRLRDRVGTRAFRALFDAGLWRLNAARRTLGLPEVRTITDVFDRADRMLVQVTEAFEFHGRERARNVVFIGPTLEEPAWAAGWEDPSPAGDARPLVVVSASSQYLRQERLLSSAVHAAAALPVRALVTTGPAIAPESLPRAPHVTVVRSASHDAVFRSAAAVVTHAGLGTVTRALVHGLPMVLTPLGRDQDDVAARVVACGAGLRVRRPSPRRLRAALGRVLQEPGFREAARAMGAQVRTAAASGSGVAELEELAGRTAS